MEEKLIDTLSESEKEDICNYIRRKRMKQIMAKRLGVKLVDNRNMKTGKLQDSNAE